MDPPTAMGQGEPEFRERFWDVMCDYQDLLKIALSLCVMLLILVVIVIPWIPRDSPGYVVLVIDIVLLIPLIAFLLYLIWRCRTRTRKERF